LDRGERGYQCIVGNTDVTLGAVNGAAALGPMSLMGVGPDSYLVALRAEGHGSCEF
jgi:hypothetical protein